MPVVKRKIRSEDFHYDKKQNNGKSKKEKPPKDFNLIKAIQGESLYKNNVVRRDKQVRKYVDENLDVKGNPSVLPGQLVMFDYFENIPNNTVHHMFHSIELLLFVIKRI